METIKELYLEALRAPADAVNLRRDPYVREKFIKKRFGKTREERIATLAKFRKAHSLRKHEYNLRSEVKAKLEVETQEKRVDNAKIRRKLGFMDFETDANGNTIPAEDGQGVDDLLMDELKINDARY